MNFLNSFEVDSGQVVTTTVAPNPSAYVGGRRYDPSTNGLFIVIGGTPVSYSGGVGVDASGATLAFDASAGLPAGTVYRGRFPVYLAQLCVDATNPAVRYNQGLPYTVTGAIAVTDAGGGGGGGFILIESGDFSLMESGDKMLME